MPERAEVYREFGIAAEIAQAMEHDLGRVLLAHRGLEDQGYLLDATWQPDAKTLEDIHRNTLGQLIREIRTQYHLAGDWTHLDLALEARNFLFHRFFTSHMNEIENEVGCVNMCEELHALQCKLWAGHQLSRGMAEHMVEMYERLWLESHTP